MSMPTTEIGGIIILQHIPLLHIQEHLPITRHKLSIIKRIIITSTNMLFLWRKRKNKDKNE